MQFYVIEGCNIQNTFLAVTWEIYVGDQQYSFCIFLQQYFVIVPEENWPSGSVWFLPRFLAPLVHHWSFVSLPLSPADIVYGKGDILCLYCFKWNILTTVLCRPFFTVSNANINSSTFNGITADSESITVIDLIL